MSVANGTDGLKIALGLLNLPKNSQIVVSSKFTYSKNTPIPSFYASVPVLGTVLILLYAEQETFVEKILSA